MTTVEAYIVWAIWQAAFTFNRDWNNPDRMKAQEAFRADYNRAWWKIFYAPIVEVNRP